MRTLSNPRLQAVVELPPWHFLNHIPPPEPFPRGDNWTRYWRASLAASGFEPLNPIFEGSEFVPVVQFEGPGALDAIIRYELTNCDVSDDDWPLALDGGYVLYDDEDFVALPQCCASLRDLVDWKEAVRAEELGYGFCIGIGHPYLAVDVENEWLLFKSDGPDAPHLEPFRCERAQLLAPVEAAEKDVLAFRMRLASRAEILLGEHAAKFCDGLVGKFIEGHDNDEGWRKSGPLNESSVGAKS